jgi:3-hydroxyisobutyrate dehydrogenase
MLGVNLVAAAEAIAFARYLNVDLAMFHRLVSDAAGASKVFIHKGLEMIEGSIGDKAPEGSQTLDEAVAQMEKVVQKARDLHCPLHLGNAALEKLLTARRHGLGGEASTSVIKMFGQ